MNTTLDMMRQRESNPLFRLFTSSLIAGCVLWSGVSTASGRPAYELLSNGGFTDVLVGWTVPASLDGWIPYQHPQGTIALHPSSGNYSGTIVTQSLNVTGIANQTVNGAIDLGCDWSMPAGNTVAVYLGYLDNLGALQRLKLINPDNSTIPVGSFATFTGSFTFPANAGKLVSLSIEKEGDGDASADNVSLLSSSLTPGPVPHLSAIIPNQVAYGQAFVMNGRNFGSGPTPPVLTLNGTSAGLTVNGWTDTTIQAVAAFPAASGLLMATIDGTPTCETREFEITSPHYSTALPETTFHAVPGQAVAVDVQVDFRNGYTPSGGGIQLQVFRDGVAVAGAAFAPNPLGREGGSTLTIDTTALPTGRNHFQVLPVSGGVNGPDSFFDIFVEIPVSIGLTVNNTPVTGTVNLTQPSKISASYQLLDSGGQPLAAAPRTEWSSSDDAIFGVYVDYSAFGTYPQLLPRANGDAVLHAYAPGGFHQQWAVHVEMPAPAAPSVVACTIADSPIVNASTVVDPIFFQTDTPFYSISLSFSPTMEGCTYGTGNWGGDHLTFSRTFSPAYESKPGKYLLSVKDNTNNRTGYATVVLTPAADRGILTGHVRDFGAKPDPMGQAQLYGTLEFYDPATETKLFERSFSQFGSTDINVPGLPPGSYKLRWLPNSMLGQSSSPNWWPNANTYADASPVAVSAGTVTADIHFFLAGPATAPAPPKLAGPSVLNPATHTFSLPITTESGGYYQLQKSFSMREGTWFNIGWANYGSGSPITLTDPDANEPAAFYRASRN